MPKPKEISMLELAVTLGRIEESQRHVISRLDNAATKDQFTLLEKDVNKLGEIIRENHSDHDSRLRSLEAGQSRMSVVADWALKVTGAAALAYWGIRAG